MILKTCLAVLVTGVFLVTSINSVVEANCINNVANSRIVNYGLFDDIKNEIKNDIKNKVKQKKKQVKDDAKKRIKDGVEERIGDLIRSK